MESGSAPRIADRSAAGIEPRDALAALAALAFLIVATTLTPITNNDLFLHLKTGEVVLSQGRVPEVDDYSALARGRPFTAHEWLAGVVFHLIASAGGWNALILFKCFVAVAVALLLYAAARTFNASPVAILPCLALVMLLAAARILERPHIFSYLLLAGFLLLLARRRSRASLPPAGWPATLAAFVPLQVLWANLHGSFLLGPVIVGLASLGALLDGIGARGRSRPAFLAQTLEAGRLAALAALLLLACLVNPYGVRLLRFPFELTGSAFMDQIYEWLPPYEGLFRTTYMARYYVAWTLLGMAALAAAHLQARRGRARPIGSFPYLLFAAFFGLSLRMNRNVTDFALVTLPGVSAACTVLLPASLDVARGPAGVNWRRRWFATMALVFLGLGIWFAATGYPYSPSGRRFPGLGLGQNIPRSAADYLERNGIEGPAMNSYGAGAYLIYRFYPKVRVGMDSRNDVYGEALYAEYQKALLEPDAMKAMLHRLDAAFIFLEWPQQGAAETARTIRLAADGWVPVYFDDTATVYLKEQGPRAAVAQRDRYRLLEPSLFIPGQWTDGEAATALDESDRAVAASVGSYIARVMRIEALLTLGRLEEARAESARIAREDPPLQHIETLLGLALLAHGDRAGAAARLRRALELNPYSEVARQALARATD